MTIPGPPCGDSRRAHVTCHRDTDVVLPPQLHTHSCTRGHGSRSSSRSGSHIAEQCAWRFFETSRTDPPRPRRPSCSWGRDTARLRAATPALSDAAGFMGASFLSRGAVTFPDTSDLTLIRHEALTENEHHIRRRMQGVGAAGGPGGCGRPCTPRTRRCRALTGSRPRSTGHHGAGLSPARLLLLCLSQGLPVPQGCVTSPDAFGGSKTQFK